MQHVKALQQKKFRDKYQEFVVEGTKLTLELLKSNFRVKNIFATPEWISQNNQHFNTKTLISPVSQKELERMSGLKTSNSVLSLVEIPNRNTVEDLPTKQIIVLADGIRDPGNLGTIIRSADWFGVNTIICSEDSVDLYNPKVVQATMGSLFRVNVFYKDLLLFLKSLSDEIPVYGAFLNGENIYSRVFGESGVLVIGSESHGIRPEVEARVKTRLHIPAITAGAESLNASIAAAICLSEIKRSSLKNI